MWQYCIYVPRQAKRCLRTFRFIPRMRMRNGLFGHLLSIETWFSIQWFCLRTAKAMIRLRGCAVWSGLCCSHLPKDTVLHGEAQIMCMKKFWNTYWRNCHFIISLKTLLLQGLSDILNIDNPYFEEMVTQIYPNELQLNKTNPTDTEAASLDLYLLISNGFVSSKIYGKRDDFEFDIVNFPFFGWRPSSCPFLWCLHFSNYTVC